MEKVSYSKDINKPLLVICNTPDSKTARAIAQILIKNKVAACVNVQSACRSFYHWNNKVVDDEEIPLLIKTTRKTFDAVCQMITKNHPFDVPEIIAIDIVDGLPAYLKWINEECR